MLGAFRGKAVLFFNNDSNSYTIFCLFLDLKARQFLLCMARRTSVMGNRRLLNPMARHPWGKSTCQVTK